MGVALFKVIKMDDKKRMFDDLTPDEKAELQIFDIEEKSRQDGFDYTYKEKKRKEEKENAWGCLIVILIVAIIFFVPF